MPLYVFICACGRSTESLSPRGTESIACACGKQAQRRAIYATAIGGRIRTPVSQRPIHLRQYTEATEQLAYEHARAEESAQRTLPSPPLGQIAIRRARQVMQAGVKDSLDYRPESTR